MKKLKDFLTIKEFRESTISEQNLLAIMCAVKTLMDENVNYSMELKTNNIKPTIGEYEAFHAAKVLVEQDIWKIK